MPAPGGKVFLHPNVTLSLDHSTNLGSSSWSSFAAEDCLWCWAWAMLPGGESGVVVALAVRFTYLVLSEVSTIDCWVPTRSYSTWFSSTYMVNINQCNIKPTNITFTNICTWSGEVGHCWCCFFHKLWVALFYNSKQIII